eukprot:Gb_37216 [translate_table: standard]
MLAHPFAGPLGLPHPHSLFKRKALSRPIAIAKGPHQSSGVTPHPCSGSKDLAVMHARDPPSSSFISPIVGLAQFRSFRYGERLSKILPASASTAGSESVAYGYAGVRALVVGTASWAEGWC